MDENLNNCFIPKSIRNINLTVIKYSKGNFIPVWLLWNFGFSNEKVFLKMFRIIQ